MILFAIAVLGGAASVLTPCVLPLLPAILVISRDGGRRRAWGIAAGIELSFFLIAVVLAGAITALGLPANILRWVAAVLLAIFGLVLVVPRLDEWFTTATSKLAGRIPQRGVAGGGFRSGFLSGLPLGLVWAPCAGPILAGITVAATASRFSSRTVVTMLGYALGMAGPLTAVIMGGQSLSQRLRKALGGGRRVLAPMGVVLLLTALLVGVGGLDRVNRYIAEHINLTSTPTAALERRALTKTDDGVVTSSSQKVELTRSQLIDSGYPELGRLADLGPAPDFDGISRWYNSRPLSIEGLRGKVVLVDFWTYSCINCIRTLPRVRGWYSRYAKDGLVVVGVHTPEFRFEADPRNVGRAVRSFDIGYPVALDPQNSTWDNYYNRFWPAHYLIDRDGRIRSVHYGEGEYVRTENEIRTLLGMPATAHGKNQDVIHPLTPETYLGYLRAERFESREAGAPGLVHDEEHTYSRPADLGPDVWAYDGTWTVGSEDAVAGDDATIYLHFRASKVFIVAGPPRGRSGTIRASLASGARDVVVDRYKLYEVRSGTQDDAVLRLDVSPGVKVYSFTFG